MLYNVINERCPIQNITEYHRRNRSDRENPILHNTKCFQKHISNVIETQAKIAGSYVKSDMG